LNHIKNIQVDIFLHRVGFLRRSHQYNFNTVLKNDKTYITVCILRMLHPLEISAIYNPKRIELSLSGYMPDSYLYIFDKWNHAVMQNLPHI